MVVGGNIVNHVIFGVFEIDGIKVQTLSPTKRYRMEATLGAVNSITGLPETLAREGTGMVSAEGNSLSQQVQLQNVAPNSIVNWRMFEVTGV
jgi:hypothetical protein